VIDTFRAFTTAAFLLEGGVSRLVLCDDVELARHVARELGAILVGEDAGIRPAGFDHGNSPARILTAQGLRGEPAVLRSSAGTRTVIAAINAGAEPVYASSLVVASATAAACAGAESIMIISAGTHGVDPSYEDDVTGDLIVGLLHGVGDSQAAAEIVRRSVRARQLIEAPWAGIGDVDLACDVDRIPFAMRAVRGVDGHVELTIHRPTTDRVHT
jgi:2-phosphosulfolactate phosphatase